VTMTVCDVAAVAMPRAGVVVIAGSATLRSRTIASGRQPSARAMCSALLDPQDGLLIGEVAKQSGASRKALRLYEAAGILPPAQRTEAGYRIYGGDALHPTAFVRQAQRLGFSLDEIREIVAVQRSWAPAMSPRSRAGAAQAGTSIEGPQTSARCGSAWKRCFEVGGRSAQRRPRAFRSSERTASNRHYEEGGHHDPIFRMDADATRRCRRVPVDRADAGSGRLPADA
jgi:DNA-binding transcriptional MerR regulator